MIAAFEQRLADVLGARMPVPFRGRVNPPPFPAATFNPDVLVGVAEAVAVEPDIGTRRPEVVPGADDPRRVLRLNCTVGVQVRPGNTNGRVQQMTGLDAALYLLDAPDMRDGSALRNGGDPGFLIQRMGLIRADSTLDPDRPDSPAFGITLQAEGWFWPAGTPGQTGVTIADIRIRGTQLPIMVSPGSPELTAGGPAVELTISIGGFGTMQERGPDQPLTAIPFGNLALSLEQPGGKPGAGTLSGGVNGEPGIHLVPLTAGEARVTYGPPAAAVVEDLVIAMEAEPGFAGLEIGRFGLRVR